MFGSARTAPALRSLERLYDSVPISLPTSVRHAYLRRTLSNDFGGYEHPPDPLATLEVAPDRIEQFTGRPFPPYHGKVAQLGTVRDGDWDRTHVPSLSDERYRHRYELYRADRFTESVFYESLAAHFEDGVAWTDTPFVRRCLELAEQGVPSWRSSTTSAEIRQQCARADALYERIEANGYRAQRELEGAPTPHAAGEVVVDVGRNGSLLFVNGRHRLAIAKLLGVETIPVGVLVRHADWMAHRDACARRGRIPPHPDLRDLADCVE